MAQKWAYKVVMQETKKMLKDESVKNDMSETLNQLGDDGWELVSTTPLDETQGMDLGGSTKALMLVFKRAIKA